MAGGSVEKGWRVFKENGFRALIGERYVAGALLLGVSAGAVQPGRGGLTDDGSAIMATFGFLPLYVGVHEEGSAGGHCGVFCCFRRRQCMASEFRLAAE